MSSQLLEIRERSFRLFDRSVGVGGDTGWTYRSTKEEVELMGFP